VVQAGGVELHIAAERHAVVGSCFLRVANLMAPPQALFSPGILARVLWSGRRPQPAMGTSNPPTSGSTGSTATERPLEPVT